MTSVAFCALLLTHHADKREAYDKSEGKRSFADFCLFVVRREVNKYLIDSYINSWDVYHVSPLWAVVYFFAKLPLFNFMFILRKVQVQAQVYFSLLKLIQYKMAYRISRLTNDEK